MPFSTRPSVRATLAAAAVSTAATFLLAGCASPTTGASGASGTSSNPTGEADDRPVVLTTFTVLADIAENVAGEHLRVESITKVGAEIHGYEPTPGDIARQARPTSSLTTGWGSKPGSSSS